MSQDSLPHQNSLPGSTSPLNNQPVASYSSLTSLVPRRSGGGGGGGRREGRRKRTPGTHCLHMHLISEKSRKIGYFSNSRYNVDANFNFSRSRSTFINVRMSTVSMARHMCECSNSPDARQIRFKRVFGFGGVEWWNGTVEWNGMDWTGTATPTKLA